MSEALPLPKKPGWWALLRYRLAVSNWRLVNHAAFLLALAAIAFSFIWLTGNFTDRWITVTEPERALPREQWPQIPDAIKPLVLGDDGNPVTLNLIDVRNRLNEINANAGRLAHGEPAIALALPPQGPPPAAGSRDETELAAYQSWVSGSACSISDWKAEARAQVAALVRSGVWGCSGVKRGLAWWPLVIQLGLWPGLLLTLLLAAVLLPSGYFLGRSLLRHEADYRLHRKLFGSWAG